MKVFVISALATLLAAGAMAAVAAPAPHPANGDQTVAAGLILHTTPDAGFLRVGYWDGDYRRYDRDDFRRFRRHDRDDFRRFDRDDFRFRHFDRDDFRRFHRHDRDDFRRFRRHDRDDFRHFDRDDFRHW